MNNKWIGVAILAGIYFFSDYTDGTVAQQQTALPSEATEIIKEFEGFSETAYWDVNAWRAGYGSDTITLADGSILPITKDSVVTREDAERDLARRTEEFKQVIKDQTSADLFLSLPPNVQIALKSVAYNYGSLPDSVVKAVESGDVEAIASAVEALQTQDNGINRNRRIKEAEIIRGDL